MDYILVLTLLAIVVSIVVGFKFNINSGIIAMGFAFVIGVLGMNMKVNAIIAYWPTTIVFFLLAISLFYNYAVANGTMGVLGKKLLYMMGGNAKLIPFVCFAVSCIVAMLGAGGSTNAIVGPFIFAMALEAGINPIITACAIGLGTLMGSDNPFNGQGGIVSIGLLESFGYTEAFRMQLYCWFNDIIKEVLVLIIIYIVFKGYRNSKITVEKPEAFTPVQKKTMYLIVSSFVLMVVPNFLAMFIKNDVIAIVAKFCQPQCIMILCAIVAPFLKLGNQRDTFKQLPMNTFIMIAGMSFLIGIATEAGLVESISGFLSNSIPTFLVGPMLLILAAFLSFFSSGLTVVCPLLYPLVPGLEASLGLNPVMLISCIYIGAMCSALSPFSTGGSMLVAACADVEVKDYLSKNMIWVSAIVIPAIGVIMAVIGLFGFFHL